MNVEKLRVLLRSKETGNLEFKREWYKIDSPDSDKANRQKGELIKDILSLANGNTIVAGEEAYLIVGASDCINSDGTRDLFGTTDTGINEQHLLDVVNACCSPPLEEIYCDPITLDSKQVFVITIPPTSHLHETTKRLKTPSRVYDEYTVFVRHGEGIVTASLRECEKIAALKRAVFSERGSAPPIQFGATVGAMVGGLIIGPMRWEKVLGHKMPWPISILIGLVYGGFLGVGVGYSYRSTYDIRSHWLRVSLKRRIGGSVVAVGAGIGTWVLFRRVTKLLKRWTLKTTGITRAVYEWLGL